MNNLNELISYLFLIGVIIGLVIAIIVMIRHRKPKKHHIIEGLVVVNRTRDAEGKLIDTTITIDTEKGDFDYKYTKEFIVNRPILYVKYYDDYKLMQSHGQIDELGVLLTDLDQLNYKFYVIFDVLPNRPSNKVLGYVEDSHFYVTGTVD